MPGHKENWLLATFGRSVLGKTLNVQFIGSTRPLNKEI